MPELNQHLPDDSLRQGEPERSGSAEAEPLEVRDTEVFAAEDGPDTDAASAERNRLSRELMQRMRSGDEAAVGMLITLNMGLAITMAARYEPTGVLGREDLRHEAIVALARAAMAYNPDHPSGAGFGTYARLVIRGALLSALQGEGKHTSTRSLSIVRAGFRSEGSDVSDSGGYEEELVEDFEQGPRDPGELPERVAEVNEARQDVYAAIRRLRPRQRLVLALRFGLVRDRQYGLEEVADIPKTTPNRVYETEQRALQSLGSRASRERLSSALETFDVCQ